MASKLTVRADVVDAGRHVFAPGERFLVDTNLWFWTCYEAAPDAPTARKPWQSSAYPSLLDRIVKAGGRLLWSPFSWSELGHIVERTEWEIALKCGATSAKTAKQYRYESAGERARVVEAIKATWAQVEALAEPMPDITLTPEMVSRANEELPRVMLDGYDLFLAQQLRAAGIAGILTDDKDYLSVEGIRVFTLNRGVLGEAATQGRLR